MKKRVLNTGSKLKRKATNSAKQFLYQVMWRQPVPAKKKKA